MSFHLKQNLIIIIEILTFKYLQLYIKLTRMYRHPG